MIFRFSDHKNHRKSAYYKFTENQDLVRAIIQQWNMILDGKQHWEIFNHFYSKIGRHFELLIAFLEPKIAQFFFPENVQNSTPFHLFQSFHCNYNYFSIPYWGEQWCILLKIRINFFDWLWIYFDYWEFVDWIMKSKFLVAAMLYLFT